MSEKSLFVLSSTCTSKTACHACRRAGSKGRVWRDGIRKLYEVPAGDKDMWSCPHGVPGEEVPVVEEPPPSPKWPTQPIPEGMTPEIAKREILQSTCCGGGSSNIQDD